MDGRLKRRASLPKPAPIPAQKKKQQQYDEEKVRLKNFIYSFKGKIKRMEGILDEMNTVNRNLIDKMHFLEKDLNLKDHIVKNMEMKLTTDTNISKIDKAEYDETIDDLAITAEDLREEVEYLELKLSFSEGIAEEYSSTSSDSDTSTSDSESEDDFGDETNCSERNA